MTTAIDLPPDIEHRLDLLAARTGRSRLRCLEEIIKISHRHQPRPVAI